MNSDLQKRLEEAAREYATERMGNQYPLVNEYRRRTLVTHDNFALEESFLAGAEHGYKEAIKVAKEWLKENTYNKIIKGDLPDDIEEPDCCTLYSTQQQLLADFEADMNKFLEEKK